MELTKEFKVRELKRCKNPIYFIKNYIFIQHPTLGKIPFKTWKFQEQVLEDFQNNKFNIVLKSRQLGLSTLSSAYILWMMLFRKNSNIATVSIKRSDASDIIKKIKYAYKFLPDWLQTAKVQSDNVFEFSLENGSRVQASATTSNIARGQALSLLFIDEAAFIDGLEEAWASAWPTLSTGGSAIINSCVPKDTFIFTKNGLQQIEDLITENIVNGFNNINQYHIFGKDKLRSGNLFFKNGTKKTKIIKTKFSEIECTEPHKLWSFKNGVYDWVEAKDLSVGDYVSIQYGMNVWGNNDDISTIEFSKSNKSHNTLNLPENITENISYFLGLFLAEGSHYINPRRTSSITTITCGDNVTKAMETLGLPVNSYDEIHNHICSKQLTEFFEFLGFDLNLKAKEKYIPSKLLQMSRQNIISLLRGFFDGDGSSDTKGRITLSLSSKKMLLQIRMLLLNLGILSYYYEAITPPTQKVKVSSQSYRLELNLFESQKFFDIIGFAFERKQLKRKYSDHILTDNKIDNIPNGLIYAKELNKKHKFQYKKLRYEHDIRLGRMKGLNNLSRDNFLRLLDLCDLEDREKFNKIADKNLIWTEIKSISDSENETYDVSLPNNESDFWAHSVLYNGILGHQTPNGAGGFFYDMWRDAEEGNNDFNYIMLPWNSHPDRDREWYEATERNMPATQFAQEYLCSFTLSGDTVLSPEIIQKLKEKIKPPKFTAGPANNLWVWQEYDYKSTYMITIDTARGDGADFSAFHVVKTDTMEVVAEFKGKVTIDIFSDLVFETGFKYGLCLVIPENNSVGNSLIEKLIDKEYPSLFYSEKSTYRYVNQFEAEGRDDCIPGLFVNSKTRPWLITKWEEYMRTEMFTIYSSRYINELENFVYQNGKPQSRKGKNDDLVICAALACWVRDTALSVNHREIEYKKQFLNSIKKTTRTFSGNLSGEYSDIYKYRGADGQFRDCSWIIKG